MLLRYLGAGAIALALIILPHNPAFAAGMPLVTGKCGCRIGWGVFIAPCGSAHVTCTKQMCAAACQAALPKKSSREITDVSAARRIGRNRDHIRNASLPPARYRGGGTSRARRGFSPPPRMDLARAPQTDRDGRGYAGQEAGVSAPIRTVTYQRARGVARAAIGGARASSQVAVEHSRPAGCYGIPWCGCWLRKVLGIPDPALNLAANWARVGQPATVETANVVVWPHHVGKLLAYRPGQLLIQSGNDGGAVRTRWVSPNIRGHVLAYRRV